MKWWKDCFRLLLELTEWIRSLRESNVDGKFGRRKSRVVVGAVFVAFTPVARRAGQDFRRIAKSEYSFRVQTGAQRHQLQPLAIDLHHWAPIQTGKHPMCYCTILCVYVYYMYMCSHLFVEFVHFCIFINASCVLVTMPFMHLHMHEYIYIRTHEFRSICGYNIRLPVWYFIGYNLGNKLML